FTTLFSQILTTSHLEPPCYPLRFSGYQITVVGSRKRGLSLDVKKAVCSTVALAISKIQFGLVILKLLVIILSY
ncbi:hypothetical protein, partial [Nostoc sp. JL31]|uniref:hypothetical protein n=1 Tax=Nostoc sp. JL31 TaxID=2815395 RepID=UPI0025EE34B3